MIQRRVVAGPAGDFSVFTHDSGRAGHRVVVLGGVHGDETEGALAAGRLAVSDLALVAGRVDIVPICHEAAFAADSRTSPVDDGNLARVFPGDPTGPPTALLAHHLYTEVLEGTDFLVDLHTSGRNYDMPFLAGYGGELSGTGSPQERAAIAFGADFVWRHPGRSEGRTVSVVEHAIYTESPGMGPANQRTVNAYCDGVLRVLQSLDMVASAPAPPDRPQIFVTGGGDLDRDMTTVGVDGAFLVAVSRGEWVEEGTLLGTVIDLHGQVLEEHRADGAGWVMALKARSPVSAGDLVVCLAADEDKGTA
jgi:predicted deacylase